MSELEDKIGSIAERHRPDTRHHHFIREGYMRFECEALPEILALIKIRVKCPECLGDGKSGDCMRPHLKCSTCKGTGEITKSAESGDRGEIL